MTLDIVSLGECMIELFSEKSMAESRYFEKSFAGDTLNVIVAASKLGSKVGYITKIGGDPFGDYLLENWKALGIDTSNVIVEPYGFNGLYFIILKPEDEREFIYYRKDSAPSTITPKDLRSEYIKSAKIFHTSGISQAISDSSKETVKTALEIAKDAGVKTSFDPNFRQKLWPAEKAKEALKDVIEFIDIIFPSAPQETEKLLGISSPEDVIKKFWDFGVEIVCVKTGCKGAVIGYNGEIRKVSQKLKVEAKDTTGTGDAFCGAFLNSLLEEENPFKAAEIANTVAALKTLGRGAIKPLPDKETVEKTLKTLQV
jgi:2-dehydro-3-deoxygluconokinase